MPTGDEGPRRGRGAASERESTTLQTARGDTRGVRRRIVGGGVRSGDARAPLVERRPVVGEWDRTDGAPAPKPGLAPGSHRPRRRHDRRRGHARVALGVPAKRVRAEHVHAHGVLALHGRHRTSPAGGEPGHDVRVWRRRRVAHIHDRTNATEQIDWSRCVASPTISPTLDTYATRRA